MNKRIRIDNIPAEKKELDEQELALVAGGMSRLPIGGTGTGPASCTSSGPCDCEDVDCD